MVAGARGTGDARGTVGGLVAGGLATYVDAEDGAALVIWLCSSDVEREEVLHKLNERCRRVNYG